MFTHSQLKNGATLLTIPFHDTKAVTLLVLFPVGSRYETNTLNGAAHFIEHMMFKGTAKRPTTLTLSRELDRVGAEYNAYTSKDHTGYYIKIDAHRFELACDLLSDMLFHSKFDHQELEREKGVIAEELRMYEDNPLLHADELLEESLFAGSSLGWKIGGTPQIIGRFTRDALVRFRDKFYGPERMVLAVAGHVPDHAHELIEQYFGKEPSHVLKKIAFQKYRARRGNRRVILKWKETEQVMLACGVPSFSNIHPNLPALSLLHIVLGGTMSSRLFIAVRERRGLAYMVKTSVNPYQDTGSFMVVSGLARDKVDAAIRVIMRELARVRAHGVTTKELDDAKEHVHGRLTLSLEESSELAEYVAKQHLLKGIVETPEEWLARIDAVTREEVLAVARDIFHPRALRLALIGPFKDEKRFAKLLR